MKCTVTGGLEHSSWQHWPSIAVSSAVTAPSRSASARATAVAKPVHASRNAPENKLVNGSIRGC